MRGYVAFLTSVFFLTVSMTCQKRTEILVEEEPEIITFRHTDRNDVPPPPKAPWWTLDTTSLDFCQQRIWDYVRTMYPVQEENYWDYNIYAIKDEPADELKNREWVNRYMHFFIDTIYSRDGLLYAPDEPCAKVDSTFFWEALGPPTSRSYHAGLKRVNYFYYFRLRYRRGPCAYIFDEGHPFEQFGNTEHFNYCALLKAHFSEETGKLIYISFYGPG